MRVSYLPLLVLVSSAAFAQQSRATVISLDDSNATTWAASHPQRHLAPELACLAQAKSLLASKAEKVRAFRLAHGNKSIVPTVQWTTDPSQAVRPGIQASADAAKFLFVVHYDQGKCNTQDSMLWAQIDWKPSQWLEPAPPINPPKAIFGYGYGAPTTNPGIPRIYGGWGAAPMPSHTVGKPD